MNDKPPEPARNGPHPCLVFDEFGARAAPCRTSGNRHQDILRAWLFAASLVAACGVVLFGPAAFKVLVIAVISAVLAELAVSLVLRRPVVGGWSHTCLTGLLLGLMLPATVAWYVPVFGSLMAIVLAKSLFGGLGRYLWQPAVVGRVLVQFIFKGQLSLSAVLAQSPILAPGHLLVGDLTSSRTAAVNAATYPGWLELPASVTIEAWRMPRPVQTLRGFARGDIAVDDELVHDKPLIYEPLLRDALPSWKDTLLGLVPGGIGETCTLGLVIAGLYLIYRGFLRWQLPVSILVGAALAAAVLPVETVDNLGGYRWLPIFENERSIEDRRAVGVAYVLYHLTAGQLMLGAFLLAGDTMTSPLRVRGQVIFGAGIGGLTIFMRLYGHLEGECYWAILLMNWLVPIIDRRTKRPVLGAPT